MSPLHGEEMAEAEIRETLSKHYGRDNDFRDFHKNVRQDSHGEVGSVVYSLDGSPPKGYAIYLPGLKQLNLYDNRGKRFRIYKGTTVIDWEEESDE